MRLRTLHEAADEYQVDPETIQRLVLCGKIRLEAEDIEAALEEGVEDMPIKKPLKGAPYLVFQVLRKLLDLGEQPSFLDLAKETGYAVSTISRAIGTLEERGYIEVIRREGKNRNEYRILKSI